MNMASPMPNTIALAQEPKSMQLLVLPLGGPTSALAYDLFLLCSCCQDPEVEIRNLRAQSKDPKEARGYKAPPGPAA